MTGASTDPMEAGVVTRNHDERRGFFEVVTSPHSYLNLLYLILSLPLGIFYFSFLTSGLSLGLGTLIIGVGIFILLAVLAAARGLASLERALARAFLDTQIEGHGRIPLAWEHPLRSLKETLTDSGTWKGILFLLIKLPLGIVSFVLTITLTALTLSLLLTPLALSVVRVQFLAWRVSSAEAAVALLFLGLLIGVLSLHLLNAVASVWRVLARALLRGPAQDVGMPVQSGPIVIP
jgi:hypothetical protein